MFKTDNFGEEIAFQAGDEVPAWLVRITRVEPPTRVSIKFKYSGSCCRYAGDRYRVTYGISYGPDLLRIELTATEGTHYDVFADCFMETGKFSDVVKLFVPAIHELGPQITFHWQHPYYLEE